MRTVLPALLLALCLTVPAMAQNADTDGDGISDAIEKQLSTDPHVAEQLTQVATDKTKADGDSVGKDNYAPGLDIVAVYLGNVAGNRYLWRIDFADQYAVDNSGLIIYLYGDDNPKTGRSDMGCEYMLTCHQGAPDLRAFTPDGRETSQGMRAAIAGKSLYLCADLTIQQQGGQIVGAFSVLHETKVPYAMVDSIGLTKFAIADNSSRAKIISPGDLAASRNMQVTWGFRALENLKRDPKTTLIHPWECELSGYQLNIQTEYVNRHVICSGKPPFTITAHAPKAGKFHVGFITYQSGGRKNLALSVGGKEAGVAVADQGNNRECLFFTDQPLDLKRGDEIKLEAVAGTPIVEEIVLLPQPPPVVTLQRTLTHLEARSALTLDGRVVGEVTFITSWPAVCGLRVGRTSAFAGSNETFDLREEEPLSNHRFWLNEVQPGQKYEVTVETQTPEGEAIKQQASFAAAIKPPAGTVQQTGLRLSMTNDYAFDLRGWPVTQGLPFPQGALVSADHLKLLDAAGKEVPLQATVLGYWPDYSIKWVLLDFQTDLPGKQTVPFMLQYGTSVKRSGIDRPLQINESAQALTINTGRLQVELPRDKSALLGKVWLDSNGDGKFGDDELVSAGGQSVMAAGGKTGAAQPAQVKIMRRGPLHSVVRIDGATKADNAQLADQVDLHFHAGKPYVVAQHTFTNTNAASTFTDYQSLYLSQGLNLGEGVKGQFGGDAAAGGKGAAPVEGTVTLWQAFDDSFTIGGHDTPAGIPGGLRGKRAQNWSDMTGAKAGVTVAVRYLWQLYPKSITLKPDGIAIGLMPRFAPGTYQVSKEGELEDKLYYYLKDGAYKLKCGVSKRHELLFAFHGPDDAPLANECAAFDEPPILKADRYWYCNSGAFADIMPSTPELGGMFLAYERNMEKAVGEFLRSRESGREYGMLNFGDWWGERGRNWGNIEYDTQYAFYLQFVRSGDERYFRLAEQAARHNRDVDMIWAGDKHNLGKVYAHCIGHTGNYYDHMVSNQGSPSGGCSVSHSWCEGYLADYFLSGDLRGLEAAALLADNYDTWYANNYDFENCRTNGWHLIMTMGQYRATSDPFYLNAARIIMDRTAERETPGGGWDREMMPGHCLCLPRHRGEAAFMVGILLSGLRDYNAVAHDPEVDNMIARGADWLIKACWVPEKKCMRYTSCPVSSSGGGLSELIGEGMLHGYMHSPDKTLGDVMKTGTVQEMRGISGFGKSFTQQIRRTPAILKMFAECDLDNYDFAPGQTVQITLRQPVDKGFMVTLRPRGDGNPDGMATLTKDGKVVAEAPLQSQRNQYGVWPAVVMEVKPGSGTGLYVLKLDVKGDVPWDFDCDLDKQIVDLTNPTRFGPKVRLPNYMVFVPDSGKTTVMLRGLGKGGYEAQLRAPGGRTVKLAFADKAAPLVADPAAGIKGLCELQLTKCPGAFELQIKGALPYLSYWPSQLFAPSEPIPGFNIQGNFGPGGSREVTFDASASTDADNDIVRYAWDFGDGQTGEGKMARHAYAKEGSYVVVLTVTDKLGVSGQVKRPVSMPADWVLALDPRQSIVLEAENFTGQGKGTVEITQRVGSVGNMITKWEANAGHWLEWAFDVPQAGDYNVVLRYCTASERSRRELTIDGQAPVESCRELVLPTTGGFSTDRDDWRFFRVPAKAGGTSTDEAARCTLSAGKHILRLANIDGGLGLDQIMLLRAQ